MSEKTEEHNISFLAQAKDELLALLLEEDETEPDQEESGSTIQAISPAGLSATSFPLSFAQQRLWFFAQKEPASPVYNVPCVLRLQGRLRREALTNSLQEICRRHAVLRATFTYREKEPQQIIAEALHLSLPLTDLRAHDWSQEECEQEALQIAAKEVMLPFDLQKGPLVRGRLLHLGEDEHILILIFHHIVFDGWSKEIVLKELGIFYAAFQTDKDTPSLPDLPIQYPDYVLWQRKYLSNTTLQSQLQTYWRKQLAGELPLLELPTDHPRPAVQSYHGASIPFTISSQLHQALQQLSQREETTLFMTLLTAWNILLYRYTGQQDLLVGTPIANRTRSELEHLIGMFVNMLVLRTHIDDYDNPTFLSLLQQVRETTLSAYAHQDLPFEQLVELLQPRRDPSYSPLFQIAFVMQSAAQNTPQQPSGGITITPLRVPFAIAKFDLTLEMMETEQGLAGYFEYNTDLFDRETIQRLCDHWLILLEGIIQNPHSQISSLPLLSAHEMQQMLVDWNITTNEPIPALFFHKLLTYRAEQNPESLAIIYEQTPMTYQELERRSNQLAHHLQALGIGPNMPVGIYLERTPEVIVGILGTLKAGGCYVPLDPGTPKERLMYMLEAAQINVLLTQQALLANLPQQPPQTIVLDNAWPLIAREELDPPVSNISAQDLAYIMFTSGTTGKPKGVPVMHRGLGNLSQVQKQAFAISEQSRILQFASFNFDASIWEIIMALANGACLVMGKRHELLPGGALLETLRKYAITHVTLPPSALALLSSEALPDLQVVISAGEALTPEIANRWANRHRIFNAYGPTEATVCATMTEYRPDDKLTIGRPIAHTQIYILDARRQPVPIGVTGEIYIGGAGLARGYLGSESLTNEKFLPHPFSTRAGERVYKTGDLARYCPDGTIEYLGRVDQQIKIRGFRIEPGEIESLLNQYPGIAQCLVLPQKRLSDDTYLLAYIVLDSQKTEGGSVLNKQLRQYLQNKLPDYMIPSDFVYLEKFPVNASGKIDRRALPVPSQRERSQTGATTYVAPQTQLEKIIAEQWQAALQVKQVGLHDNFFDLGGHSLLTVQIQQQLQQVLQREIALVDLFKYTTVSTLSRALSATSEPSDEPGSAGIRRTERASRVREQMLVRKQSHT